jgi:hypothetical protein
VAGADTANAVTATSTQKPNSATVVAHTRRTDGG